MKRTIKTIAVVLSLFLIVGCATPKRNYMPEATNISEPPIGSINTAFVGDEMLKQGKFIKWDAIYIKEIIKPTWSYTLFPGYYIKQGEDTESSFYLPSNEAGSGKVEKRAISDNWKSIQVYKSGNKICVVTVYHIAGCTNSNAFERTKTQLRSRNSFQQTLIYSGRFGNKINIGYREFSSSKARPAFNNDVEYDLSVSNQIGYKGSKLKVLEATNEHIRYKVIRNFNKATR